MGSIKLAPEFTKDSLRTRDFRTGLHAQYDRQGYWVDESAGKISNYGFGLTPFTLPGFGGGSLLGFIRFSVHIVYLGSIAADIIALGARNLDRNALEWSRML